MPWWVWIILVPVIIIIGFVLFRFIRIACDIISAPEITYENYKDKIFPRLVTKDAFDARSKNYKMPYRLLGDTGLYIVYVFDKSNSVIYISAENMKKLDLTEEDLNKLALINLEKTFPKDLVEKCINENSFTAVKLLDSYDAARVLILPKYIPNGSKIVALIPDKNTLAITPYKENNESLKKLKSHEVPADGEPLLKKPLIVCHQGIELLNW